MDTRLYVALVTAGLTLGAVREIAAYVFERWNLKKQSKFQAVQFQDFEKLFAGEADVESGS